MRGCAGPLLWAALAACLASPAHGYTVDCNHEYADCEVELNKYPTEDEESSLSVTRSSKLETTVPTLETTTPFLPTIPTTKKVKTVPKINVNESALSKPKARLLNAHIDEDPFNRLNNNTAKDNPIKALPDLSDVTLYEEDEEEVKHLKMPFKYKDSKLTSGNFFANLKAPFHNLHPSKGSVDMEMCRENDISYKVGERLDRGCEETCECSPSGTFECSPRCKHPYIRRGRTLNDPLCFESPIDECCSIIACAGNDGDSKSASNQTSSLVDSCRFGNATYHIGAEWNVGCEKICECEKQAVITCKARCKPIRPSDKCINVQDPKDACCEIQVCDVSQDVHEEPIENMNVTTSTPKATTAKIAEKKDNVKTPMRPLVLAEPIGSVKVLQNNSVQVNLIHMNTSDDPIHLLLSSDGGKNYEDIELTPNNLILYLKGGKDYVLKTKETDTKFNFTITAAGSVAPEDEPRVELMNITSKIGCYHDGKFYAVGEEFRIGCTELCECTGDDTRECAALECPAHVGLELMSRGCVRWAPTPPPQPPNCCPRAARCLSDGTCHYKEHAIPNWSEVPVSLTGCEQRCFCENGELDCQEICTPLPSMPPQNFRCKPGHRLAPVNISDDDCCKEWGCISPAGDLGSSHQMTDKSMNSLERKYYNVTPVPIAAPIQTKSVLAPPPSTTKVNNLNFFKFDKTNSIKHHQSFDNAPSDIRADIIEPQFSLSKLQDSNIFQHTVSPLPKTSMEKSDKLFWTNPHYSYNRPFDIDDININNASVNENVVNTSYSRESSQENLSSFQNFAPKRDPFNYETELVRSHLFDKVQDPHHSLRKSQSAKSYFFTPYKNKTFIDIPRAKPISRSNILSLRPTSREQDIYGSFGKYITVLHSKDINKAKKNGSGYVEHNSGESKYKIQNSRILNVTPTPYESVLLKGVAGEMFEVYPYKKSNDRKIDKSFSTMDLESILGQLEIETEVGRNIGRSALKPRVKRPKAGPGPEDLVPPMKIQPKPTFLPTIQPEILSHEEDIPDVEQNNIHKPTLPQELPLPPGLPPHPIFMDNNSKFSVLSLQADSPTSVKMLFGLPSFLVGLKGSVDLRYTDTQDEDTATWSSQIFAPADEILTTPRLEFRLTGLKPSTTYKLKGNLFIHNLSLQTESEVYNVRTLDAPKVEEKIRKINSELALVIANDTTALLNWRHFTTDELQFIDGIQIRYRPVGTPIYTMTELLHHSRSSAELHELRSGSRYEASLVLVPPPRAATELQDPSQLEFTTAPFVDPYNWSVIVDARTVGSDAAELTWRGIPAPPERWVRIYRAAHACGAGKTKEHDAFRLASRDQPATIVLTGLEPNSRCRVWLELFLTNGKVKTSNVLEVNTKSEETPEIIDNVIEASVVSGGRESAAARGDYYGALVVVGVVAALGAVTSLLLLLVVVRRHRPHSVPITSVPTAPRESSLPPYDNPAYKLELQQETMDL